MRTTTNKAMRCGASLCVALMSSACADFDQVDHVEDMRILAVRTEPAEIFYSPFYVLFPPAERPPFLQLPEPVVDVIVYAFDPRGGLVETSTQFCPEEGDNGCLNYKPESSIMTRAPDGKEAEFGDVYLPRLSEQRLDDVVVRDPTGRIPNQNYQYTFTTAVMDSILRDEEGNAAFSIFSLTPQFVFQAVNQEREEPNDELGFKRLPFTLNFFDPGLPIEIRDAIQNVLGVTFCTEPVDVENFVEGEADCMFERGPNENPALIGFNFFDDDEEEVTPILFAESSSLGLRSLVEVTPGTSLRLRPVFLPLAVELYQVFSFNLDAQELILQNRREDFALNWYVTRGEGPGTTEIQFGETLDGVWQLPSVGVQAGDRDALVLTVRDQRGGVTVAQITVVYRSDGPGVVDDAPEPFTPFGGAP